MLNPDRFFSSDSVTRSVARELYEPIAALPIVSPHGHVDPSLFIETNATFSNPTELFVFQDHYVKRLLASQGFSLESVNPHDDVGRRMAWHTFCENFYLFRGTPSGVWLMHELSEIFGVTEKPSAANANQLYDIIADKLTRPQFTPRALFEQFNIEVLSTTDAATDTLDHHQAIRQSGWNGKIIPTFRPDGVVKIDSPNWLTNIQRLGELCGFPIEDYRSYIHALEMRRDYFRSLGAIATDHDAQTPASIELSPLEAAVIFQRALHGQSEREDNARFVGHILTEMARMSIEDGLVMQLHAGSFRNHDEILFKRFGADNGADIPTQTEYTRNLHPLLNKFGNDPRLTLIVFTLDESAYSRDLAPLAAHYSALKLGPPWWFHDSLNGMARYFDQVMETTGLYNTVGFNDDARSFYSIPARHDVWRRSAANWVAGLVTRHVIDMNDAIEMMIELAIGLARRSYKLEK